MTSHYVSKLIEDLGIKNARALDGMLQKHSVPEDWKISVINGMWHRSSAGFTHSELRQAISSHDTDSCTDIRNHISPNTVVLENNLQEQFQEANEAGEGR